MTYKVNFLEFIAKEEQNLLTTLVNFRDEFDQFSKVDGLYQSPGENFEVNAQDAHGRTLMALYQFTHNHLYFSFATLMRCHLSDGMASTRKAIDATLTAYRLHMEPGTLNEYLESKPSYLFIKKTIERARKRDQNAYPLSPSLLNLHGICSEMGSHADIDSFAHRLKVRPQSEGKAAVEYTLFQFPPDPLEFRYYLASTLAAYMAMLRVFIPPLSAYARNYDVVAWQISTDQLGIGIERVRSAMAKEAELRKAGTEKTPTAV